MRASQVCISLIQSRLCALLDGLRYEAWDTLLAFFNLRFVLKESAVGRGLHLEAEASSRAHSKSIDEADDMDEYCVAAVADAAIISSRRQESEVGGQRG